MYICDRPRENQPSSYLGMIVKIPVLKVVISITSFCSCYRPALLSRIVLIDIRIEFNIYSIG